MPDLSIAIALLVLLFPPPAVSAQGLNGSPTPGGGKVEAPRGVDLAPLAPRASTLSRRYTSLESQLRVEPDLRSVGESVQSWQDKVALLEGRLQGLKASRAYRYAPLSELRVEAQETAGALEQIDARLTTELSRLVDLQQEWTKERSTWEEWERTLKETPALSIWRSTVVEAMHTADRALGVIATTQAPLLHLERRVGDLQARALALGSEATALLDTSQGSLFRNAAPSILSPEFVQALRGPLWADSLESLASVGRPTRSFFASNGWVVLVQAALALLLCHALVRHRAVLGASDRWSFLGRRPFAAGVFVGVATPSAFYGVMPLTWTLVLWTLVTPAAARLVAGLINLPWKRRLLYGLAALFWLSQAFRLAGLPDPLFRAYVTAVAALGLPLALWRARESVRRRDTAYYTWGLRFGALVFAAVLLTQVGGYSVLATHLLDASIETTFLVLLAWTLALLLRGGVEFTLDTPLLQRLPLFRAHAPRIARRLGTAIDVLVGGLTVGGLLKVWGLYETPVGALSSLLATEFTLGGQRFTLGLVLLALCVLYGAFLVSWTVQALTVEGTLLPALETGARISIARLAHYALVLIGFSFALGVMGIDLRNLTILAGAFGVGIGFGLQNIVNNFVSGLILLFERPVKVGDVVQMGGEWGQIKRLGLRSTVIRTYAQSEIIVPNSDLVSNQVTNWTLTDRQARIVIPVGVAYGSDLSKVMGILSEVAENNPAVRRDPERQVLFRGFGESSLDLELRVWIDDVVKQLQVQSDILGDVERRFRQEGVEIPFPQRDLRLRGVDASAGEVLTGSGRVPPSRAAGNETVRFSKGPGGGG